MTLPEILREARKKENREMTEIYSLMPDVGVMVNAWYGSHSYRAMVIKHGKKYPYIRFKLKSGRVVEGPATIIEHDASTGVQYRGFLAQMFHPSAYER